MINVIMDCKSIISTWPHKTITKNIVQKNIHKSFRHRFSLDHFLESQETVKNILWCVVKNKMKCICPSSVLIDIRPFSLLIDIRLFSLLIDRRLLSLLIDIRLFSLLIDIRLFSLLIDIRLFIVCWLIYVCLVC